MITPVSTIDFIDRLVAAHPELEPLRNQHLGDNFGEMLPHLLMVDIAKFVATRYADGGEVAVDSLLHLLETEAGRDPDIDAVIELSFIEMLPYPGEPGAGLEHLLGPRLRAMFTDHHG